MLGKDYLAQDCAVARALELVGERWTLLIVRDAFLGVRRFSEFQERLDIPRAVLATRLRSLVANGLMERRPDPEHRGRDLYQLTAAGEELWPVIYSLRTFGVRRGRGPGGTRMFRHDRCGAILDDRGVCSCGTAPPPSEIITTLRPDAVPLRDDRVSRALVAPRRLLEPLSLEHVAP